jgi:hypothetical protein
MPRARAVLSSRLIARVLCCVLSTTSNAGLESPTARGSSTSTSTAGTDGNGGVAPLQVDTSRAPPLRGADDSPMSPASEMQAAMAAGELSFADVRSPRKSSLDSHSNAQTSWQEGTVEAGVGDKAVLVEVIGSEAGRVCPSTGLWQLNEGKGSRHVRYVLRVSARGQSFLIRRRWRQLLAFSKELQKLSKGWLKAEDCWHETNRLESSWRNPGFDEKKLAERCVTV